MTLKDLQIPDARKLTINHGSFFFKLDNAIYSANGGDPLPDDFSEEFVIEGHLVKSITLKKHVFQCLDCKRIGYIGECCCGSTNIKMYVREKSGSPR